MSGALTIWAGSGWRTSRSVSAKLSRRQVRKIVELVLTDST